MSIEMVMISSPHALLTQEVVTVSGTGTGDTVLQHGVPGVAKTQHLWDEQLSGCAHATHTDALSTEAHFCLRWKNNAGINKVNFSCCLPSVLLMALKGFLSGANMQVNHYNDAGLALPLLHSPSTGLPDGTGATSGSWEPFLSAEGAWPCCW